MKFESTYKSVHWRNFFLNAVSTMFVISFRSQCVDPLAPPLLMIPDCASAPFVRRVIGNWWGISMISHITGLGLSQGAQQPYSSARVPSFELLSTSLACYMTYNCEISLLSLSKTCWRDIYSTFDLQINRITLYWVQMRGSCRVCVQSMRDGVTD